MYKSSRKVLQAQFSQFIFSSTQYTIGSVIALGEQLMFLFSLASIVPCICFTKDPTHPLCLAASLHSALWS